MARFNQQIVAWLVITFVWQTCGISDLHPTSFKTRDFRHISFQELQQTAITFQQDGVTTYSQLLFDVARNQVLVGARDALFRLSLPDFHLLENASWPSPEVKTRMCLAKGQSEENCHNFVKVLLTNDQQLFVCGTESFSPSCTWREIENINKITNTVDGIARCPYHPSANITALLSDDGDYFIGGPTDFSGSDFAIYKDSRLRTKQYDSMWLNEPQFVGSFETDKFVYFVFREAAVEYINCGKIIYSRIARVCKQDTGGHLMLKDNWTTFIKARLNCSIAGEYPFYYNEVQDLVYVEEEQLLYATFSTGTNSIPGSALCAFNMSAINAAFAGPFKHQQASGSAWSMHYPENPAHFECSLNNRALLESSKFQLMDNAVQAISPRPLYDLALERFTHIAVDVLASKVSRMHIAFVATSEGTIRKLSIRPGTWETCLIELWHLDSHPAGRPMILNVQYLKDTNSLYVGTQTELMQIPADHCNRHRSQNSCMHAKDPYCGWNAIRDQCTTAPNNDPKDEYWLQYDDTFSCPILDAPIDGGWSPWSSWRRCQHSSQFSDDTDECRCRTRQCDAPAPRNGGVECEGMSVMVSNCTLHGGWTSWSAWSECSASCGVAVKTRTRTCSNPAPAHGGRVCVGQDRSEVICTSNPPCPVATPTPQDGGWGQWEAWSGCTQCGRGFRSRVRRCNNPPPLSGGLDCIGTSIEYEECFHSCPEQRKSIMVALNATKKVKFICRVAVASASLIHVSHKEIVCKNRHCAEDVPPAVAMWGPWTEWSRCNVTCGNGVETRERRCDGRECKGHAVESRQCRVECSWGCWSDWSPCSVSCGWGIKKRYRSCLGTSCVGGHMQEEPCNGEPCNSLLGWGPWSAWSQCDHNHEQHRKRICHTSSPSPEICQGQGVESRMCLSSDKEWAVSEQLSAASFGPTIAFVTLSFIVGCFAGYGTKHYQVWKMKQRQRIPSSPHYMSTKLNPYITVPYHDRHSKRHPNAATNSANLNNTSHATSGQGQSHNGTLRSLKFDLDTLKRNNHNNCAKMDVFADKYYE